MFDQDAVGGREVTPPVSITNNRQVERVGNDGRRQVGTGNRKASPKFILAISFIQIAIHYIKTPHDWMLYLQFDPTRRYEIWRFFTPALIHAGRGDINDELPADLHLWTNMFAQLYFGFYLEQFLTSFPTCILYAGIIFFSTLTHSIVNPRQPMIGASGGYCGFMLANIVGHLMMGKIHKELCWKSVWIYGFWSCADSLALTFMEPDFFGENIRVGHSAHLGGALGGFLLGVILWPEQRRRDTVILRKTCGVIIYLFVLVAIFVNIHYAVELANASIWFERGQLVLDNRG